MESQRIKILLNRYFEAESTRDEENELINYFNSGEVEDELKSYIPMFMGLKEMTQEDDPALADELMDFIMENEGRQKSKTLWRWQIMTGVAASILLGLLAVNFYSHDNQWDDTFSNPQQAYMEANKTLLLVAEKYNKGLAYLQPLNKVEDAATPLYSGMKTLNKGMEEYENIGNLKTNIKK